jgi:hypothetical protein
VADDGRTSIALRWRALTGEHNLSKRIEPVEERFVIPPNYFSVGSGGRIHGRFASPESSFLHSNRDLSISVRGFQADVTKPSTNHIDVDTGFEKMNGSRMPE